MSFIVFEGPEEERNMNTLVEMINSMEVREDDETFKNAVDYMFDGLGHDLFQPRHLSGVGCLVPQHPHMIGQTPINSMEVREDDETFKNAVDYMFDGLERRSPQHFAVRQYKKYKLASSLPDKKASG